VSGLDVLPRQQLRPPNRFRLSKFGLDVKAKTSNPNTKNASGREGGLIVKVGDQFGMLESMSII
jgi:hypothetical protein